MCDLELIVMANFGLVELRNQLNKNPIEFTVLRSPPRQYRNAYETDEMTKIGGARANQFPQKPIWKESTGWGALGMDNKCVGSSISKGLQCINERCTEQRYMNIYPKSRIDLFLEHNIDDWLNLSGLRAQRGEEGWPQEEYMQKIAHWRSIMRPVKVEIEKLLEKEWMAKNHNKRSSGRCELSTVIWEATKLELLPKKSDLVCFKGEFILKLTLRHTDWGCDSSKEAVKELIGEHTFEDYELMEQMAVLVSFTLTDSEIVCSIHLKPDAGIINNTMKFSMEIMNPITLRNIPHYDEDENRYDNLVRLGRV